MSNLQSFMASHGYKLDISENEIRLEKKRRFNIGAIIFGLIFVPFFIIGGIWLNMKTGSFILGLVILLIVIRFNTRGLRPVTIFDWSHTKMIRKSLVFFANSITINLEDVKGVAIRFKDLASDSSEGVDDFEKTIYIKTGKGDINVVDFYSEKKGVEPELEEFRALLENYLLQKA